MSFNTGDFAVTADGKDVGRVRVEQNGLTLVFDSTCDYRSHEIVRLAAVCSGKYVPIGVMIPSGGGQETITSNNPLHLKKSFTKNALTAIGYNEADSFHLIKQGDVYEEKTEADTLEVVLPESDVEPVVYNDFPDPIEYAYDFVPAAEPVPEAAEQVLQASDVELATPETDPACITPYIPEFPDTALSTADGWTAISNPGTLFNDPGIREYCGDISNARVTEQDGCVLLAIPISPTEPFPLMPVFCFGSSGSVNGEACIIFKVRNGNLTL